jgi:TonB family protein
VFPTSLERNPRFTEATVQVQYVVAPDGSVSNVELVGSAGYSELDQATLDAMKALKCKIEGPRTTPLTMRVPFHFKLE